MVMTTLVHVAQHLTLPVRVVPGQCFVKTKNPEFKSQSLLSTRELTGYTVFKRISNIF